MNKLTLVFLFAIFGCIERQGMVYREAAPHDLDSIARKFFYEASVRGILLDTNRLALRLQFGRLDRQINGKCTPNTFPKVVTIDSLRWKYTLSNAEKEQLVFHELSHCLLGRGHENSSFLLGECKSWLREDNSKCAINLNNLAWREYYLDELFRPETSPPAWYRPSQKLADQAERSILLSKEIISGASFKDTLQFSGIDDWLVEVACKFGDSELLTISIRCDEMYFLGQNVSLQPIEAATGFISVIKFGDGNSDGNFQGHKLYSGRETRTHGKVIFSIQKKSNILGYYINGHLRHCVKSLDRHAVEIQFKTGPGSCDMTYYQLAAQNR